MAKIPDRTALGATPSLQPGMSVAGFQPESAASLEAPALATAGMGKTLMGIGAEVQAEQEKIDTVRVEDAWNQYKTKALDLTIAEGGVLTTKGVDAVNGNIFNKATQGLSAARESVLETLGNDRQRERFMPRADATDLQTKHQVLQHLVAEQQVYAKTVFEGTEAAARAQVAAMPTDQNVFNGARDTVLHQADVFLTNAGVRDPGARQALKDKLSDSLWMTRIDALLLTNPAMADALFRANSQEFKNTEARLTMQARTREAGLAVTATQEADRMIQEVRDIPRKTQVTLKPGSRASALAMLDVALTDNPANYDALEAKYVLEATGEQTTNGLPNSRDIAAQLPLVLARVERRADVLYGKDTNNPDRAAFVRKVRGEIQAKISSDVQQLNAIQRQAQGTLIDAVTGTMPVAAGGEGGMLPMGSGRAGTPGTALTSFQQIQGNPTLYRAWQTMDPQGKLGIERLLEHNMRAQAPEAGDVVLYRELFNRIHLAPGDPKKIDFYQQIIDPAVADRLSMPQIQQLRQEIDRAETPGGRSPMQLRKNADSMVALYFKTNVMFTAQPERQIAATMKWNEDAGRKIDEYAKAGKDIRPLFMLDTPESIVSPKYLQTYVNSTPALGLAAAAGATTAAQPTAIAQPATIDTREKLDAWFKTLPEGVDRFVGVDGQVRMIPGRKAAVPNPAAPQDKVGTPAPLPVMTPTGQIIQPAGAAPEAEIKIPVLVDKRSPEQLKADREAAGITTQKRDAAIARAVGYAVTAGAVEKAAEVVVPAAKTAGAAVARAAGKVVDAITLDPSASAVASFRELLATGRFSPQAEGLIIDAISTGALTPAEARVAAAMLKQIGRPK